MKVPKTRANVWIEIHPCLQNNLCTKFNHLFLLASAAEIIIYGGIQFVPQLKNNRMDLIISEIIIADPVIDIKLKIKKSNIYGVNIIMFVRFHSPYCLNSTIWNWIMNESMNLFMDNRATSNRRDRSEALIMHKFLRAINQLNNWEINERQSIDSLYTNL